MLTDLVVFATTPFMTPSSAHPVVPFTSSPPPPPSPVLPATSADSLLGPGLPTAPSPSTPDSTPPIADQPKEATIPVSESLPQQEGRVGEGADLMDATPASNKEVETPGYDRGSRRWRKSSFS
ncbi:hypothetical protein LWI28_021639 [Acer negundo]|uniref:Uncharacterized protein n=1 Tax=Acer negundo TaxID=4023 RepID=A0AAD5IRV6_ACENE|nr:hypothetical protein LWI28_021639 [Acer negundo]